jgi:hypothetical protein
LLLCKFKLFELRAGIKISSVKGNVESTIVLRKWNKTTLISTNNLPCSSFLAYCNLAVLSLTFYRARSSVVFMQNNWHSRFPREKQFHSPQAAGDCISFSLDNMCLLFI